MNTDRERLDIEQIRKDFPILSKSINGKPLAFLDSAASTQKPRAVIDSLQDFYSNHYANIHRGVYELSATATHLHEEARSKIGNFIGAQESRGIIFTRNASEAINLVAQSVGRVRIGEGDEILLTEMEHHSNIVPWQLVAEQKGARIQVAPIDDDGVLLIDEFRKLLNEKTRIVAISHVSNALGTINPVSELTSMAHEAGAIVLVDGAQAVPRLPINVAEIGCDFYVFSGHKVYGPTGIGVLYGKPELLETMPPYQGGGDMIRSVSFKKTTYAEIPQKFEAGTPHIAGAIGLGAAIDYLSLIGMKAIADHENKVLSYGTEVLQAVPGLRLIGKAPQKTGVLSFVIDTIHPHDIGTVLDQEGIAIRAGHHCAQPLMDRLGLTATARASLGLYNIPSEIDRLARGIEKTIKLLG